MKTIFLLAILSISLQSLHAQWVQTSIPPNEFAATTSLHLHKGGLYAIWRNNMYKTVNNGDNWEVLNNDSTGYYQTVLTSNDSFLFVGNSTNGYGRVLRSADGGTTWKNLRNDLPNSGLVQSIATHDSLIIIGLQGIYISHNNGNSWQKVTLPIESPFLSRTNIFTLGIFDSLIIAGVKGGIFRSEDAGNTWEQIPIPNSFDFTNVIQLGNNIYISDTGSGVYKSVDKGKTWIRVNQGLELSKNITTIAKYDANHLIAWVTIYEKLFLFDTTAEVWRLLNYEPKDLEFRQLLAHNGFLFGGTARQGIWRTRLNQLAAIKTTFADYIRFNLYPNPAKTQITLSVEYLKDQVLQVSVYDLVGKKFLQQSWNIHSSIQNNLQIETMNLPKGLYHCVVASNSHTISLPFVKL
jgi:photosystem II stability/assembly factor-like uncharacterized protein